MERNQSSYRPCKMYMLSGNCLYKSNCSFNHLAPKVAIHKKLSTLKKCEPFNMNAFNPNSGEEDKKPISEEFITETKQEKPPAFNMQANQQAERKPVQQIPDSNKS